MNDFEIKQFIDGRGVFYQRVKISDNIEVEEDTGFLYCKNAILGHIGTQVYSGVEIGELDKKVVNVVREPQDVFAEDSIASFVGKPITLYHPDETVTSKNIKDYAVGQIINVWHDSENIYGDLVIQTEEAVDKVLKGELKDLSLGYNAKLVPTKDGYKQEEIVINHLAIVKEGRAVNARIVDEKVEVEDESKEVEHNEGVNLDDTVHTTTRETIETVVNQYDDETGEERTLRTSVEEVIHTHTPYEKLMSEYRDSLEKEKLEKKEVMQDMEKDFKYFAKELDFLKAMPKSEFRDKAFEALNTECKELLKVELPEIVDEVKTIKDSVIEKSVGLKNEIKDENPQEKKDPVLDAKAEERFFARLYRSFSDKNVTQKYTSMTAEDVYDALIEGRKI